MTAPRRSPFAGRDFLALTGLAMAALAFATSTIIAVAISALLGAILGYTNITFMTIGMTLVTLSALLSANVRRMGLEAVLEDVGDADETLAAQAVAA